MSYFLLLLHQCCMRTWEGNHGSAFTTSVMALFVKKKYANSHEYRVPLKGSLDMQQFVINYITYWCNDLIFVSFSLFIIHALQKIVSEEVEMEISPCDYQDGLFCIRRPADKVFDVYNLTLLKPWSSHTYHILTEFPTAIGRRKSNSTLLFWLI